MLKQVEIFTDGSCLVIQTGGYGAIMRYRQHENLQRWLPSDHQ